MMAEAFCVGPWLVEPGLQRITGEGESRTLGPKVMATLVLLAERGGEVVSKDELVEIVWQGAFCSDEVVTSMIYELRRSLGDRASDPRFVDTVRGRGYRWIAPIEYRASLDSEASSETREEMPDWRRRGLWAASLLLFVGAMTVATLLPRESPPPSLAVMPLQDDLGDRKLSTRLTFDLASTLARSETLHVFDAFSPPSFPSSRSETDLLLEGRVERFDDRVLVAVELLDVERRLVWGATFESAQDAGDAVDSRLIEQIAQQIRLQVVPDSSPGGRSMAPEALATLDSVHGLAIEGRHDEAAELLERELSNDPSWLEGREALASVYYRSRRFDEALFELSRAGELSPESSSVPEFASRILLISGRSEEAYESCRRLLELEGVDSERLDRLAAQYRTTGSPALIRSLIEQSLRRQEAIDPFRMAALECLLGRASVAMGWLERAEEIGHEDLVWLGIEPAFDSLRGEPAFEALVARFEAS